MRCMNSRFRRECTASLSSVMIEEGNAAFYCIGKISLHRNEFRVGKKMYFDLGEFISWKISFLSFIRAKNIYIYSNSTKIIFRHTYISNGKDTTCLLSEIHAHFKGFVVFTVPSIPLGLAVQHLGRWDICGIKKCRYTVAFARTTTTTKKKRN